MQEDTLYIDTVETDKFYRWPKFSVLQYSVARRCRRHGDRNFRRRPRKFSQIMNCRRRSLFGLLRAARFEDKKPKFLVKRFPKELLSDNVVVG